MYREKRTAGLYFPAVSAAEKQLFYKEGIFGIS